MTERARICFSSLTISSDLPGLVTMSSPNTMFVSPNTYINLAMGPSAEVPKDGVAEHVALGDCAAFLEVVDLIGECVRYIPVHKLHTSHHMLPSTSRPILTRC